MVPIWWPVLVFNFKGTTKPNDIVSGQSERAKCCSEQSGNLMFYLKKLNDEK